MTDAVLEQLRGKQQHRLLIPRQSAASVYAPTTIVSTKGETVAVPKHQAMGLESQIYLNYFSPVITGASTVLTNGSTQSAGNTLLCEFQLRASDLICTDWYLEIEFTLDSYSTNSIYYALMPGPLIIDSIQSRFNGGTPFQYLYGDILFRALCFSLAPEKLYQYALASGGWLSPSNAPGNRVDLQFTLASSYTTWYNSGGNNQLTGYQQGYASKQGYVIFPWQPDFSVTSSTNSTATNNLVDDASGKYCKLRIPMVGLWMQQIGVFPLSWIADGVLYIDVYGAGGMYYQGYNYNLTNTTVTYNLVARGISFPGDSKPEQALVNSNLLKKGMHFMYLDYARQIFPPPSSNPTANSTYDLLLDFTTGRHTAFLLIMARNKTKFSGANIGWLICPQSNGYPSSGAAVLVPDATSILPGAASSDTTYYAQRVIRYLGQRTVWGDQTTSQIPSIDVLDNNNQKIFSNGGSVSVEQWQALLATKILPNNPWMMDVVKGVSTVNCLGVGEVPFFFCDPVAALQGVHTGSIEFPPQHKLRITYGANACPTVSATSNQNVISAIDAYAAQWRCLHIQKSGSSDPQIAVEEDPSIPMGALL